MQAIIIIIIINVYLLQKCKDRGPQILEVLEVLRPSIWSSCPPAHPLRAPKPGSQSVADFHLGVESRRRRAGNMSWASCRQSQRWHATTESWQTRFVIWRDLENRELANREPLLVFAITSVCLSICLSIWQQRAGKLGLSFRPWNQHPQPVASALCRLSYGFEADAYAQSPY